MSFREFEVKNKPLFASLKRARNALVKAQLPACKIEEFFDYLEHQYPNQIEHIEYVTFYDFCWNKDNVNYHIAYIYTAPSLEIRNLLFEDREIITVNTGWYPMVSGSRANFTSLRNTASGRYWNIVQHKPPYVHLGKPVSIRNVACDISSTSLLLKCERGHILLDTGFEVTSEVIDDVDFIFISHFHKDHTGGLYGILRQREVPVILSGITLEYLLNLKSVEDSDKERLIKNAVLVERLINLPYINSTLEFFDSYHCPGAYGIKYKYFNECFVYPGDLCLTNGFYDFSDKFQSLTATTESNFSIVMDCALVPKGDFSITDKDFDEIAANIRASNNSQVFVSRGAELLFNVYIRLFIVVLAMIKGFFIGSERNQAASYVFI